MYGSSTATSKRRMINFLIITHGEFGAYLVEAAEAIVGAQPEGVRTISISPRHRLEEIRESVTASLKKLNGAGGLIVTADMPGGTPSNVALPLLKDMPGVHLVSGVNLYMLVGAFTRRKSTTVDVVARRMVEDGKKSILDLKEALKMAKEGSGGLRNAAEGS